MPWDWVIIPAFTDMTSYFMVSLRLETIPCTCTFLETISSPTVQVATACFKCFVQRLMKVYLFP